jgi:ferric-dicitrate binding protein FerR (iron transport regulator)
VAVSAVTLTAAAAMVSARSADPTPRVVDVPSRPAFVRPPGGAEASAQVGQVLTFNTMLRTQKPGRMQVRLADGRSFRLGGDALLRLSGSSLDLRRGQIIAWVNPGSGGGSPLRVKTRVGTASIEGTTVFIDATDTDVKVFSWEGSVAVTTDSGQRFMLRSGEQLSHRVNAAGVVGWEGPTRLSRSELDQRRARSILLNGFNAPMETLPVIEKELGFGR